MINYVIINGVNSNTITGLMINELPPITKPQMRAMQEEIDGRDGDITTNLGYSAYDKTITIGLFGTGYDINDIVAFFNGEGTVVFSNEPDKYYNFKIINQIDYVALQKFKTASITFHCQPFKYPLTETPLEIEYSYIEDEGESLTLNNTGEAKLELNLKGNTSQYTTTGKNLLKLKNTTNGGLTTTLNSDGSISVSGTATYQVAYLDTGESVSIPAGSLSLSIQSSLSVPLRMAFYNGSTGMGTMTISAGQTSTTNTFSQEITDYSIYIYNLVVGTTYNFTIKPMLESGSSATSWEPYTNGATPRPDYPQQIHEVSGDNTFNFVGKNLLNVPSVYSLTGSTELNTNIPSGTYICNLTSITLGGGNNALLRFMHDNTELGYAYFNTTQLSKTITINDTMNKIYIYSQNDYGSSVGKTTIFNGLMISTNGGAYEPYQSQSKPLNLGDLEYNAIGDYKDEFVKVDGEWFLRKNIPKYSFTGNETPNAITDGYFFYFNALGGLTYALGGYNTKFQVVNDDRITGNDPASYYLSNNQMAFRMGSTKDRLYIKTQLSSSDLKSTLANTPLYYVTTTPQYIPLNDTLQNQIEDIYNATMSYEGQTNISQVNNDLPFKITAKALEQGSNEVVVNNIGNVYSKPLIALEGSGNVDIYLDNTQILKANVEDKMNIDIAKLEAYNPDTSALLNRQVIGNYNSMTLQPGDNTIRMDGTLTKATITNYTRWL